MELFFKWKNNNLFENYQACTTNNQLDFRKNISNKTEFRTTGC